ncbi:MAG TPA: DUF1360 domain-containing protein [Candidatus Paceibacterota bacterium]|nr:DUF1360 domain-containing protein [Candidatus Paceibacterota bacterium]
MEIKNDQNLWNFLFSLLFLALLAGALFILYSARGDLPQAISLADFLLIALATFRLTRLFVYDRITKWFRDLFLDSQEKILDGVTYVERTAPENGPRRTISDLLGCPWCIGVWFALFASTLYFLTPFAWYLILVLALSGLATLIQLSANLLGWSAEHKKLSTEEKERMI